VTYKLYDQNLFGLLNYAGGDGWRLGLRQPDKYSDWQSYESTNCTEWTCRRLSPGGAHTLSNWSFQSQKPAIPRTRAYNFV